jgi:hypothetical protein
MKCKYFFLIITCLIFSTNSLSQKNKSFFAYTFDEIYWKKTRYMCNTSPLSAYIGIRPPLLSYSEYNEYKSVYKELPNCEMHSELPRYMEKNYSALWTIIDSILYLYDADYICAFDSGLKCNLVNIEKFLNTRFSKKSLSGFDKKDKRFKNGVIPAV